MQGIEGDGGKSGSYLPIIGLDPESRAVWAIASTFLAFYSWIRVDT